jgi:hypothetical protein
MAAIPRAKGRFVQIVPLDMCGSTRNEENAHHAARRRIGIPTAK